MCWLRIDDAMYTNRKVLRVSTDAKVLYVWAMDYSAHELTDGILEPREVAALAGMLGIKDWEPVATELCDAGLFERDGDLYVIHDYLDYNPSREKVLAEREANAKRQAEWQAKNRDKQGRYQKTDNAMPNTVSDDRPVPVPVPNKNNISTPKKGKRGKPNYTPAFEEWWAAYPRRMSKANACWLWEDLVLAGEAKQADLLTAAGNYARAMRGTEEQFIKLPSTFLGPGRHWEDYVQGIPGGDSKSVDTEADNRATIESEAYQRALREGRI